MSTTIKTKKLLLDRETLVALDGTELVRIVGGANPLTMSLTCASGCDLRCTTRA